MSDPSPVDPSPAPSPTGGYALGIDLGTTFTAAAVAPAGGTVAGPGSRSAEIVSLGHTTAVVPSVIVARDDGEVLVGEAAERRADTDPARTAREFKRRLGDPVPYVLGGSPFGADALTGHLLRHVYDRVVEQQGGAPTSVVVTHPANYGEYKLDLVREAIRLADVPNAALLSEPAAAATHYAEQDRLVVGDVVAVYDFGGGTFDAAVVEVADDGYLIVGTPEGMERLGGIDFDQAVYAHVMESLGEVAEQLDPTDPSTAAALSRLRDECRQAKEALSSDTDVDIPVLLPNLHTEVRLTRTEFESMIRPRIAETTESLRRAIRSAGLEPGDVSSVLLVGGSSRIPLVAEMVGAAVGRPVALDAHPKHAIALGAALHAAGPPAGDVPPVAAVAPPPMVPPSPPASAESTESPDRKKLFLAIAAVVALLALVAGAVVINSGGDDNTAAPEATGAVTAPPSDSVAADDSAPEPTTVASNAPATTESPATTQPEEIIVTAGEIILEPLVDEPDDAFTESVAAEPSPELLAFASVGGAIDSLGTESDEPPSSEPPSDEPAPTEPPTEGTAADEPVSDDAPAGPTTLLSLEGTAPGVYGGTRDEFTCDPDLLVEALGQRPAEALAWVGVHEIEVDEIAEYVDVLTALNLTVDTRVTNHGFLEGEAIARQSVLQAGTAVLVDEFGVPRVRCSSGSPLLPPEAVEGTTAYRGPAWERFDPADTAAVAPAPEPVQEFEVLDVAGGDGFIRTVGSSGDQDRDLLPGEIVATGELDFPTDGFSFDTNTMEVVFPPTGGDVVGTFAYSINAQGISIDGSGDLTGTFDPTTLTITGTGFGTVSAGGFGGSGGGSWSAVVDPAAGLLQGVAGDGGDEATFDLTFEPYTPPDLGDS